MTHVPFRSLSRHRLRIALTVFTILSAAPLLAQDRETKVRKDKARFEQDDSWVYNDLDQGIAEARKSGKPLLVIFRCIPCEACSEFDEQVVRRDPLIKAQMEKYVCVRIVQANGMDLSQFQFDYDQSLHVFMMNADKTIYGRFGTRSESHDETQDMTVEGFAKALEKALTLHQGYPKNKALFEKKKGPKMAVKVPEEFPTLKGRFTSKLDYKGQVVKSCIHCHQVRDAERDVFRAQKVEMPAQVLYPYPNPSLIGLNMDPKETATVKSVPSGSIAQQAGFQEGDQIEFLEGQPLLSIADFQWVLHQTPDSAELSAKVRRGEKRIDLKLPLEKGWKQKSDISWRASTWNLRRMGLGGLRLAALADSDRERLKIPSGKMALLAQHVGQYDQHAVAKNAGFIKNDVIIAVDNSKSFMTESELLAYCLKKSPNSEVTFQVLRGDKPLTMKFKTQ